MCQHTDQYQCFTLLASFPHCPRISQLVAADNAHTHFTHGTKHVTHLQTSAHLYGKAVWLNAQRQTPNHASLKSQSKAVVARTCVEQLCGELQAQSGRHCQQGRAKQLQLFNMPEAPYQQHGEGS
jgi:hypothetical protein